ncbi:hypothetical protein [Streptomyces blattellae]|uniref:hypothetical protein n=1 Tax=Streptomyces blattellae TaxID=2569855 RepID=UPI0012B8E568|nr:hypothetical protein [Streptomyces blattellae]
MAPGPDGRLHVGALHGGTEKPTARVWPVDPRTGKILGWKSGFGSITGFAVNHRGDLYVSQLFAGVVTEVSHGKRTNAEVTGTERIRDRRRRRAARSGRSSAPESSAPESSAPERWQRLAYSETVGVPEFGDVPRAAAGCQWGALDSESDEQPL